MSTNDKGESPRESLEGAAAWNEWEQWLQSTEEERAANPKRYENLPSRMAIRRRIHTRGGEIEQSLTFSEDGVKLDELGPPMTAQEYAHLLDMLGYGPPHVGTDALDAARMVREYEEHLKREGDGGPSDTSDAV
jgi:hypothetical protein